MGVSVHVGEELGVKVLVLGKVKVGVAVNTASGVFVGVAVAVAVGGITGAEGELNLLLQAGKKATETKLKRNRSSRRIFISFPFFVYRRERVNLVQK